MDKSTCRLIDANFNRAREALRVMEDYARFILNDSRISLLAKQLRHDLSTCISQFPSLELLAARDTPDDVGTQLSTKSELTRSDPLAVAAAAAKRLSEALRCLEEYNKVDNPSQAKNLESIRYRAYDLEKHLLARADLKNRFHQVRLYVILTEKYCQLPILQVVKQILAAGADCIQLREKEKTDSTLLTLAKEVSKICHNAGALFIMNDRPDLAVLSNADGVHLGQEDLSVNQARKLLLNHMLVGKSTHRIKEVEADLAESPDYLAVGSIFASTTKPNVTPVGLQLIEKTRLIYSGPLIAIGGVNVENATHAITAGATGVAVCSAIISTANPANHVKSIKKAVIGPKPVGPNGKNVI
ncbi:thiamine phosphate synthase [Planctomycetota bacterium]